MKNPISAAAPLALVALPLLSSLPLALARFGAARFVAPKDFVRINEDLHPLASDGAAADAGGVFVFDAEPMIVDATNGNAPRRVAAPTAHLSNASTVAMSAWPAHDPKNGTPWFRYKRKSDAGQTSHGHFGGLSAGGDFDEDILEAHNTVRLRVGLPPLHWSDDLAEQASRRVRKLAGDGCYIRHSPLSQRWGRSGFRYIGENLYKVINMAPTGVDIVEAWYTEIEDYNYGPVGSSCTKSVCSGRVEPPCTLGHFTQVMWAETTHVGCARRECPGQAKQTSVAVCNYGPGGNIVGSVPFLPEQSEALGLSGEVCAMPDHMPPRNTVRTIHVRSGTVGRSSVPRLVLAALGPLLTAGPGPLSAR